MKKHKSTASNKLEIKSLSLVIGRSCFMKCPGCYNHFSNKKLANKEKILKFVEFIRNEYDLQKVTVSSGDPLSRPDILEILSKIKLLGLKINLDTAGIPLLSDKSTSRYYNKISPQLLLKYIDLLGLPVDGPNKQIVNKFRKGRLNYANEIFKLLTQLEKYDLKICINTVAHKGNIYSLLQIAKKINIFHNIVLWQVFQYAPIGPGGYINRKRYYIEDDLFFSAIEDLKHYLFKIRSNIILEPKSVISRRNKYILVDSGGDIWSPKVDFSKPWSADSRTNQERVVFGNVKDFRNYDKIIKFAIRYLENNLVNL